MIKRLLILLLPSLSMAQIPLHAYYGNLHSHTGYSDGTATPRDAFTYARDIASLDFLAVTDHIELLTLNEWVDLKNQADSFSMGQTFVAIAGFEWTSSVYGHCNVLNSNELIDFFDFYHSNWAGFCDWVLSHPPAIAAFNHPGREPYFSNWDNFAYPGMSIDTVFPLIEFQNIEQSAWYEVALNQGWHVSPVWNQDNHLPDWGTKNDCRAGVWADSLNRKSLLSAIKAGRTFATMDKNASVWIDYNGQPMGDSCHRFYNAALHIMLADANNEAWDSIQVISDEGVLACFSSVGNIDTTLIVSYVTEDWFFVRATQADSDFIWSAPVYLTGSMLSCSNIEPVADRPVVFPNPFFSDLNVLSAGEFILSVYDVGGVLLFKSKSDDSVARFDMSSLKSGFYLVTIWCNDRFYTYSFVKQ